MEGLMNISDLKMHPGNPRVHTSEQIGKIAASIRGNGWGRPIILSKDNYILAGHGTVQAALKLGLKEVPCKYLEPRRLHNEPEALAYMVADNKTTDESDWNYGKLELVFEDLKLKGFDTKLTGFDDDKLKLDMDFEVPDEEPEYDESITENLKTVKCPKCNYEFPI